MVDSMGGIVFDEVGDVEKIPSGVLVLDFLLGGGFPRGLVTEIVGDFSTGKTLLALRMVKQFLKADGLVFYNDSESCLNPEWVRAMGIPTDGFVYNSSLHFEECFKSIEKYCLLVKKTNRPCLYVWDSLAASDIKIGKSLQDSPVAARARLCSELMPDIVDLVKESKTTLLILNQLRSKIGISFGQSWSSCGGRAIEYYPSLRLLLKKKGKIIRNKTAIGMLIGVEIIKSRVCKPHSRITLGLSFKTGLSRFSGLLETLKDAGMIVESGGMYKLGDMSFARKNIPNIGDELWELVDQEQLKERI